VPPPPAIEIEVSLAFPELASATKDKVLSPLPVSGVTVTKSFFHIYLLLYFNCHDK
jgi:hypothetical protein